VRGALRQSILAEPSTRLWVCWHCNQPFSFCVILSSVFALKLAALLAFLDCALACVNAKCAAN